MRLSILVVCGHDEILATIIRLIMQQPDWQATGASTSEEALKSFREAEFDLVLLGSGLSTPEEVKLLAQFKNEKPAIRIIQHYGGGSGLLTSEIFQAFGVHY